MLAPRGRAVGSMFRLANEVARSPGLLLRGFSVEALKLTTGGTKSMLSSVSYPGRARYHHHSQHLWLKSPSIVLKNRMYSQSNHMTPQVDDDLSVQDQGEDWNHVKQTRLTNVVELLEKEYTLRLQKALETTDGMAAWRTALDIFEEIQQYDGRGLTYEVASSLVEVLGTRNRAQESMTVLAYARKQGIRPRIQAYSSAIGCCYRERQFGHALRVFEVMRNDGYIPQIVTYSHALSSALKSDLHELVLEIFDDMIKNGVDLNIIIYNNILNSCARAADGQSALGVVRAIRQRRLEMTQSTYHSLAICAGKTGNWELALDAMDMMETSGFEPTATIFNSVLTACAKGKQWEKIVEVYDSMPEDLRDSLRGVYLGATIMGHAKAEKEEHKLRGLEIFYKFKSRPSQEEQPNFFAYNAALLALLETNQLEKIHPLANEMKSLRMEWDVMTYQNVILSYIRGGAVETAVQMLQKDAKRIGKTTTSYREAIAYYDDKRKNPREAVRLMMQMMQFNKRLSRLDWHNALRLALELPERAPYWNFRKWMNIRAKNLVQDVPSHLMLPLNTYPLRELLQGEEESCQEQTSEIKYHLDKYHARKKSMLHCRKTVVEDEKFL